MSHDPKRHQRTPTAGWHEIASGDIGDVLQWKPGYEVLRRAEWLIGLLENIRDSEIDWNHLLAELPRFAFLRDLRAGAFRFKEWESVNGFSVREGDREEETGSMSGEWTHMWLSMDHDHKREIFRDFEELTQRLETLQPLARFLR